MKDGISEPPTPTDADAPGPAVELRRRYRHPEVRTYLVGALAALVVVVGVLLGRGSDLGAVLTGLIGLSGALLRWTAAPPAVVLLATHFLLYPNGIPDFGFRSSFGLGKSAFRIEDSILAAAAVVYAGSQYRLFGLLSQSMPSERRRSAPPAIAVCRPPEAIRPGEIRGLFAAAAAAALAGQCLWMFLTSVRVDASRDFPFAWAGSEYGRRSEGIPGRLTDATSRFVLLAGVAFAFFAVVRVAFWYWRLRLLSRDEARMLLQDVEWGENRRELARTESWRAWAKARAARRAARKSGGDRS